MVLSPLLIYRMDNLRIWGFSGGYVILGRFEQGKQSGKGVVMVVFKELRASKMDLLEGLGSSKVKLLWAVVGC